MEQKNRMPEALTVFERAKERFLVDLDSLKEKGTKIAGVYCLFAPSEIIRAAGIVPVGLCAKKHEPIAKAEETLPANLCPLIKSSYGYAISDTCPFFALADFIIGETTCDGKKKMFELLGRLKPLHLMHLPYSADTEHGLQYWLEEIYRLKHFLESQTGRLIEEVELRRQIMLQNQIRMRFQKILSFYSGNGAPLPGLKLLSVFEAKASFVDPSVCLKHLDHFINEIENQINSLGPASSNGRPRILLTGTPVGKGCEKVLTLIEEAGGIIVGMENSTGAKSIYSLVDETEDPYLAIARRYLKLPCSCMTPNHRRSDLLGRFIKELNVQGVVDLTWQCCHTYNVESFQIRERIEADYGIPTLHVETDYSPSDVGQLRTRIEAFIEMLR